VKAPTSSGEKSRLARASSRVGQRAGGIGVLVRTGGSGRAPARSLLGSVVIVRPGRESSVRGPCFVLFAGLRRRQTLGMAPRKKEPALSKTERSHVALVTGASRGIGAAVARALVQRGAAVVLAARDTGALEGLATELGGIGRAWPVELDVSDPASIAAALDEAHRLARTLGGIEWLVNCAGIATSAPLGAPADDGRDLYERHMNVNFHGARRMLEGCLPAWRERGSGHAVNVASSAGLYGYGYVSAYCASKFALVGYTLAAAEELRGSGITINAVCPHYVDSPMLDRAIERIVLKTGREHDAVRQFFREQNPGGELVRPEEVAASVVALLEGDATGRLIELQGAERTVVHDDRAPRSQPGT